MSGLCIGISGCARSGKNLFADITVNLLTEKYKLSSKTFSLAHYLKKDCEEFIKNKLGISVWSEITEEKDVFRPMLIWYGHVMRKMSAGRYWIEMIDDDIKSANVDVKIITDIRYSVYDRDELHWIKNELAGKVIHITKYSLFGESRRYIEPTDPHEILNNPILRQSSDISIEWEDSGISNTPAVKNKKLNQIVDGVLTQILNE